MPYDSEGNFTRIHNWEDDRINDIDIVTDHHDEEDDNFAKGLSSCFVRDGRTPMSGDINCAGFKIKNLAQGALANDAATKGQLDAVKKEARADLVKLVNMLSKVGDVKTSVKDKNHDNWFLCNGQAINRVTYSALFAIIGTKFGVGDGTTTFNLPDYRGKFIRGLGGDSESDIYKTQAEGLPNITGKFNNWGLNGTFAPEGAFGQESGGSAYDAGGLGIGGKVNLDASRASDIFGKSAHVTPINQALNFFIKVAEEQ